MNECGDDLNSISDGKTEASGRRNEAQDHSQERAECNEDEDTPRRDQDGAISGGILKIVWVGENGVPGIPETYTATNAHTEGYEEDYYVPPLGYLSVLLHLCTPNSVNLLTSRGGNPLPLK